MPPYKTCLTLLFVGVLWSCVLGLQRPPPRYSQQFMPDTAFTCRNKIVGSYYADPETDCQLFHVCVSVAGSVQDYRFLCPNDTAFDQESQTCADWYDVDCEAATLYYASDNFDLYRLGSGLESLHYDSIRTDAEPRDHLQHSESSDPVRSSANNLNRLAATTTIANNNNNNNNNNRDILRGSSSSNFFNNRNSGKEDDYDNEKVYREEITQEPKRKAGLRKVARKQQYNSNSNNINNVSPSTTIAPVSNNQNGNGFNNGNYYNGNNNYNQRSTAFVSSTTLRPVAQQENFNRNQNNQKYNSPSTTFRPTANHPETYNNQQNSYQNPSSTARSTEYNNFNEYNKQQTFANTFVQSPSTTSRSTEYNNNNNNNNNNNRKYNEQQSFTNQFNQNTNAQPTTHQPSTNYQANDFTNYQQRNYNNIQRTSSSVAFQSTTAASTLYDNYSSNGNNGQVNNRATGSTARQDISQTTPKYFTNNYAGSSYIPTTYSPAPKKQVNNDNQAQANNRGNEQYNGQFDNGRTNNNGQYFDKSAKQSTQGNSKATQFYDTTKPNNNNNNNGQYYDVTKAPKKATQYTNYENTNTGKYFESSTRSYENFDRYDGRSSSVTGFSPSSINKLAEIQRATTPVPRRTAAPSTYNPSISSPSTPRSAQSQPTPRGSTFVSASPRPFSTTVRSAEQPSSTARPKSGKKNDYDYAYYDNTGPLEYDGLDLEHVSDTKESAKIARN